MLGASLRFALCVLQVEFVPSNPRRTAYAGWPPKSHTEATVVSSAADDASSIGAELSSSGHTSSCTVRSSFPNGRAEPWQR